MQQQPVLYNVEKNALLVEAIFRRGAAAVYYFHQPAENAAHGAAAPHGSPAAIASKCGRRRGRDFHERYQQKHEFEHGNAN